MREEDATDLSQARSELITAMTGTREKVRDASGFKMSQAWVAPLAAGAAGLALALVLKRRKRKRRTSAKKAGSI